MSSKAYPDKIHIDRSWDPAKKKAVVPIAVGIWAQQQESAKPEPPASKEVPQGSAAEAPPKG